VGQLGQTTTIGFFSAHLGLGEKPTIMPIGFLPGPFGLGEKLKKPNHRVFFSGSWAMGKNSTTKPSGIFIGPWASGNTRRIYYEGLLALSKK
jgi:hypothetical protein